VFVGPAALLSCTQDRPDFSAVSGSPAASELQPDSIFTEYVLVVLGAGWCSACQDPRFPDAVAHVVDEARANAATAGGAFRTVGVSLDRDVEAGYRAVSRYGQFDEVVLGGHWRGMGAITFIWRDLAGQPSLPQALLLRRSVTLSTSSITVGKDELLARLIGANEMNAATAGKLRMK
jgi:thiol-disulfide isomerase/thioredoxin